MDINQKIQIRLKQLSKFNNGNLNILPQIFQCSKCRKYNSIVPQVEVEVEVKVQNCYFCTNPNYIKNTK
jgi:transcription elongation factor Elf1